MEKKIKKIVLEDDIEMKNQSDFKLTRVSKDTRFVIEKKTNRVRCVYLKRDEVSTIKYLLDSNYIDSVSRLRHNKYGDLIIINN